MLRVCVCVLVPCQCWCWLVPLLVLCCSGLPVDYSTGLLGCFPSPDARASNTASISPLTSSPRLPSAHAGLEPARRPPPAAPPAHPPLDPERAQPSTVAASLLAPVSTLLRRRIVFVAESLACLASAVPRPSACGLTPTLPRPDRARAALSPTPGTTHLRPTPPSQDPRLVLESHWASHRPAASSCRDALCVPPQQQH